MRAQVDDAHTVMAFWPGEIRKIGAPPKIKERKSVNGIINYELINPLPVPLDEGIHDFEAYMNPCDEQVYYLFFQKVKPDVIHIHTLMGMHREFISAANQMKIRTVMTSHDYFGFCPKVNLYRYGECCDDDHECRDCIQCNLAPLSLKKIQLMQSPVYRALKNTTIVKSLRKQHRRKFFSAEKLPDMPDVDVEEEAKKYRKLRAYYVSMYESIDFIHFNSTVAEEVYKRYMVPKDSAVISITHQGIKQHERKKVEIGKKVILCLAPAKPFKGWNVLKEACDQLWNEGENIELRVYSPVPHIEPYMKVKESGFDHSELAQIMSESDILVAPSIWYETFGFTVLEALSYGVPVIVSDHVGAKDIVGENGIVVKAGNVQGLKGAIKTLGKRVEISVKSWRQFLNENYGMYEA